MQYESFNNKKNKLPSIWNKNQTLETSVNNLKKIDINIKSEHFTKKVNKINILTKYDLTNALLQNNFTINVELNGFPDWAVPMTRVIPVFFSEDGVNLDSISPSLTFIYQFNYLFHRVSENSYILKFFYEGFIQDFSLNYFPLYLNLDLYIINEYIFNTSQVGVS